ncbi:MAG: anti-sigma factor [Candidatus Eremiobacteraeota bacterium]|nr:anti-sigma factor [Candidatus Eremiobacteraeota bacterium]
MTGHEERFDSVAAYALGALPPAEAAAIKEHLQTCALCREEYAYLRPAVTAVAYSAEACTDAGSGAVAVSPLLKSRIMKRVRSEAASREAARRIWPAYALAAACVAIAIVTGLTDLSLNRQNDAQRQTIADLAAPDARRHFFAGGEVVTHGGRIYIAMRNLPALPAGRVFQAWTLARGATRVAPSSTFAPGSGGVAVVALPEAATNIAAVAVSVEPYGGSSQPTTKPIAVVRI